MEIELDFELYSHFEVENFPLEKENEVNAFVRDLKEGVSII